MSNLIIVNTPFQLMSSFEAISKLGLKNNILIVLFNNNEKNTIQIENLLSDNTNLFSKVLRIGKKSKSKFFSYLKNIYFLKLKSFENILIGDLGSIQKIFISNLISNKIYLLDDGAKTILIHKKLLIEESLFSFNFKQLRYNLFGLKTSTKKTINLFTMFNLQNLNSIEIITHNFEFLKKENKLASKEITSTIYILGQPLLENKRVTKKSYEDYIYTVISIYKDCKIIYLMHRREKIENLKSLNINANLEFIESKIPGELFFLNLKYKPKAIIGVNTTLLFSLNKIFNEINICAYQFNNKDILKSKNWFEESIKQFEENKIKIIKD